MTPTVLPRRPAVNYQTRDPVAKALGKELGLQESSAHQVLVGPLAHRVAAVVRAHLAAGAETRLHRWLEPIRAALQGIVPAPLTPELIQEAQQADVEEDVAETLYLTEPTPAHLRHWIRRLDQQAALNLKLRMAAAAQYQTLLDRTA